jgi:hypothetical protein
MTIRLSTIEAASRAAAPLGESSVLVEKFIRSKLNDDGGFSDRAGRSDLYYTVFGIETLLALGADLPTDAIDAYLRSIKIAELDFVHLTCLGRCLADICGDRGIDRKIQNDIIRQLQQYRSADGGISNNKNALQGTMYGCFLGVGLYQDMGVEIPGKAGLIGCVESLSRDCGSYANEPAMTKGATASTAAAITLQHFLDVPIRGESLDWLAGQMHPKGGFVALPAVPIADLLSTATALHGLAFGAVKLTGKQKEDCLDFIDSLWSSKGGFCGSGADQALDCEYTYYGLMAIGHLSG